MKSLLRGIVLVAIGALLAVAYFTYMPGQKTEPPETEKTTVGKIFKTIESHLPALQKEWNSLSEDIKKQLSDLEVQKSIPELEDIKKRLSGSIDGNAAWEETEKKFKTAIQHLNETKAEDVAKKVEAIYQDMKKQWENTLTQKDQ